MNQVKITNIFNRLHKSIKPVVVLRGGARSSKSYSIAQYLIYRITNDKVKILISRKTMPALRITAYKLIIDLLQEYDYYRFCDHNKTNNLLMYPPTGSFIYFGSLDDPEKLKSTEWNIIWLEEATEYTHDDFMILKMRLSAPSTKTNQIILSFNPISSLHWIKSKVVAHEDAEEIVSTYKDNPFLPKEYIDLLEQIRLQDANYWRVYGLGEWGSLDHLIYNNYSLVDDFPAPEQTIYGCDFGFNAPTVVVKVGLSNDFISIQELLYNTKMTNAELGEWLVKNIGFGSLIYCDSAEPARIEELRRIGLNSRPANKEKNSVKDGIDFVKRQKLRITKDSVNTIKEIQSYTYKQDNMGNIMDEPVKLGDHAMDAMRYAIYTHLGHKINYEIITGD